MRLRGRSFGLMLIALSMPLSLASAKAWPNRHQERAKQETNITNPSRPDPLATDYLATISKTLVDLQTEQKARAEDQYPSYEPIYAPAVLIQIGLLIVGFFYTLYAKRQWAAIKRQTALI